MNRRASDKMQNRLWIALVVLTALSSAFSSYIGYRALVSMGKFDAFLDSAIRAQSEKSLLPEGY